jgi:dihydropteroate synthase
MRNHFTIELPAGVLTLGDRTLIVGVLNVTPDSFSDGGVNFDPLAAVDRAFQIQDEGADIIEIGGESTRPGSMPLSEQDELARVLPVLNVIGRELKAPISIDTYKSSVAEAALGSGASIVNDVSALRFDPELGSVVARAKAALVLMHMRGEPATMQKIEASPDIFQEIRTDLHNAIAEATSRGISRDSLIIDPGIGFGKTLEQNLSIINHADCLNEFDLPIMLGVSRKSFIGRITGQAVEQRVFGTAASVTAAILRGAHIVRVHDVKEMVEVVRVADAIVNASSV